MASKKKKAERRPAKRPSTEALHEFVRENARHFLEDPNITSVGVGKKLEKGKQTETLCIQFTVKQKVAESGLEELGTKLIPKTLRVGNQDVPTDVLQRSYEPSYKVLKAPPVKDARKQKLATLSPGVSVSHYLGSAGTLGLVVFDAKDGTPYMLSNWHVLHTAKGILGDAVVQPGRGDDNRVDLNKAGKLVRSHLGLAGDCAIASIEGRSFKREVLGLGLAVDELADPALGDVLVKSGRTTGLTFGVVRRVEVFTKMEYPGVPGHKVIRSFEIGVAAGYKPKDGEITSPGDSGSAWLGTKGGKAAGVLLGLHFAGETAGSSDEHALACYAASVFEKLELQLSPKKALEAALEASGDGFREDFLGVEVAMPNLDEEIEKDRVPKSGAIHHTHFSLVMSKERRMARFVAWNIDGSSLKKLGRKGLDFKLDPDLGKDAQFGNELYVNNKLDRGHLARRADLLWGSKTEAQRANRESFYYSNICPQHERFNQSGQAGLWGELEDAIFEGTDVANLRISVFGGPLFSESDKTYRKAKIPVAFWKLLAFVDDTDGVLKAKAYVLSQADLLNDLEALELDEFRLWQVSIPDLESRTSLDFGALGEHDTFGSGPEALDDSGKRASVREVLTRADLR